eukprot:8778446-Heterocapsa_arctica.AAC.1
MSLMFAVEGGEGLTRERGSVDIRIGIGVFLSVTQGINVLLSHIGLRVVDGVECPGSETGKGTVVRPPSVMRGDWCEQPHAIR